MSRNGSNYRPGGGGDYYESRDSQSYRDRSDMNSRYGAYRPQDREDHYRPQDLPPRPQYPPRFQDDHQGLSVRGAASRDAHRPYEFRGNDSRTSQFHPASYYPPPPPPSSFDFHAPTGPSAPSFPPVRPYDRAQHDSRADSHRRRDGGRGGARGGRGGRGAQNGRGGRPWGQKVGASDRKLLKAHRSPTPEQMAGMNNGESRFKLLAELPDSSDREGDDYDPVMIDSDSEEGANPLEGSSGAKAIQVADDEASDEDEHPRAKRARVSSPKSKETAAPPKWSNPDPYTVLPPVLTQPAKKKDVVQLIRKSKLENQGAAEKKSAGDDFISLNFDAEEGEISSDPSEDVQDLMPNQKSGFSHLDQLHPDRVSQTPGDSNVVARIPTVRVTGIQDPRVPNNGSFPDDVWPPPPTESTTGRSFGMAVERQQEQALATQPAKRQDKKRKRVETMMPDVIDLWQIKDPARSTPWHTRGHDVSEDRDADDWLHNEILDFYDYVKPKPFEEDMRHDLINRIQYAISVDFPGVAIEAFGSFASGLYLPTADMDLVAMSGNYRRGGLPTIGYNSNQMRKFGTSLDRAGLIRPGSVTYIPKAKVPIIKFVEKVTGLRVDISFENDSGTKALQLFEEWRTRYPAMPFLVALIKQFLAMRGLTEVVNGGLGGFSTICLVVWTIHRTEQRNKAGWQSRGHLDDCLLTFLDFFGNNFDLRTTGLDMRNMDGIPKVEFGGKRSKPERLLIIDPNNPMNDISGGSHAILDIFQMFSDANTTLCDAMDEAENDRARMGLSNNRNSLLGCIFAGNYETFEVQRAHLYGLWDRQQGHSIEEEGQNHPDNTTGNTSKRGRRPGGKASTTTTTEISIHSSNGSTKEKPKTQSKNPNPPTSKKRKNTEEHGPANKKKPNKAQVQGGTNSVPAPAAQTKKKTKSEKAERTAAKARANQLKKDRPDLKVPNEITKQQFREMKSVSKK